MFEVVVGLDVDEGYHVEFEFEWVCDCDYIEDVGVGELLYLCVHGCFGYVKFLRDRGVGVTVFLLEDLDDLVIDWIEFDCWSAHVRNLL